ncbi:response regulator transcription factor [Arcobacter sp. F2176]|uniref:response regulator transcription factor n=1 Tax=Arcobacter sp. F2176 TaxID=2044511 RepID=UPI00100A267E|nr:response regulator transcription factor [Arcobacter sp. F2176]RXJ79017.1 DNA-binding response regulator [Arcobacter sp. F2176]
MNKKEFESISILFVDDEDYIRSNAISYLENFFDNVFEARDASEAFEIIDNNKINIIITDINMPNINGLDMIKKIREKDLDIKIIVLSAHTQTEYLLEAIELGLIKYLVKPISHETLYPILSQCSEKIISDNSNKTLFSIDCYFDAFNKRLQNKGISIKLTSKELDLLSLLCEHKNKVVLYEIIQEKVWNGSIMSEDAIRSVARKLRKKLPNNCLENFSKIGYKITTLS